MTDESTQYAPRVSQITFMDLLRLELHGPDTWVGPVARYPWGDRLYGGQVLAQGLYAASQTVPTTRPVHSLHAYFIRPGSPHEPIRFEVERLRDGRSFSTRQVVARQSAGAILNLSVSFHDPEDEAESQLVHLPVDVPSPDDPALEDSGWGRMLDRRSVPISPGRAQRWVRLNTDLIDDPVVAACGLAFISDAAPTSAARASHPLTRFDGEDRDRFVGASIDHAIWFHRPSVPTDWHWCDMASNGVRSGRGLVQGTMLGADGRHVATVVQEVLLRARRPRTDRTDRPNNEPVSIDNEEV